MDPNLVAVLGVFMRWIHILSVIVLLGGIFYARTVLMPAIQSIPSDERQQLSTRLVSSFRSRIYLAITLLLISGIYNYLMKAKFPPHYQMWFGIKMLLALHIFSVSFFLSIPGGSEAKRARWMTGILISGMAILVISAYLRSITLASLH